MSMVVDNKIVEMRFDNKDFEKNVSTTMSTIDKLKSKLSSLGDSKKNTNSFADAFNKIDFGKITSGIASLEKRFSTFGIVGMRVIQNLTDSAMRFVKNTWNMATNTIVQGGKNRAFNIENARFQLQGLLKDEEKVQAVMDDAMEAVDGTAYGFDAAANAASQFAASGVQAGDQMLAALKGITGVAAMTNSSFEDIANIFTTVSGNGRLMGDQLNQLASRGMNAASTLTEYFNGINSGAIETSAEVKKMVQSISKSTKLTEQDIRKFVSKGMISFDIFSAAMNDTFGEHAKKANETFNGALSNMKSALGRIGAEFISPLIEQNGPLVTFFNSLRVRINEIKKNIIPFAKTVTDTISKMFYNISKWVDKVDLKLYFESFYNIVEGIQGVSRVVLPVLKEVLHAVDLILPGIKEFAELTKRFKEWGRGLYVTQNAMDKLGNVLYSMVSVVDALWKKFKELASVIGGSLKLAIQEFFPEDSIDRVKKFIYKIRDFIKTISLSEKQANDIKDAFKGVFAFFDILRRAIIALSGPVVKAAQKLISVFIKIAGAVGRALVSLDEYIKKNDTFTRIIKGTADVFRAIGSAIKVIYEKINAFVKAVSGKTISEIFEIVKKNLKESFEALKDILSGDSISKAFETVAGKIRDAFGIVKDSTEGFGTIDTSGVESFVAKLKKLFKPVGVLFELIGKTASAIWGFIKRLGPILKDVFNNIKSVLGDTFKGILDTLKSANSTDILNYAKSGALMMLSSKISSFLGKLSKSIKTNASSIGGLKGLVNQATDFVASVKTVLDGVKTTLVMWQKDIQANILVKIAIAIGILTASLLILSSIDPDKLTNALGIITVAFAELIGSLKLITSSLGAGKTGGMFSVGALLLSLSASLLILAIAMKKIADVNKDDLDNGIAAITVLFTELVGVIALLKRNNSDSATNGLVKLAAAVYILSMAVKKLSKIDPTSLLAGLGAIGLIFAEVIMFIKFVGTPEKFGKLASGLIILAVAMSMFAGVIKKFGKMGIEKVGVGLIGFAGTLTLITAALMALKSDTKGIVKVAFALSQFAIAMTLIGAAFRIFAAGNIEKTANGLAAFAGVMAIIVITYQKLQNDVKGIMKIAGALSLFGLAMVLLGSAFRIFSSAGFEGTATGLAAFAGTMAVIVLTMQAFQENTDGMFKIAGNLMILAVAITVIAAAVKKFADLGFEAVATGLVGFAGAMVILVKSLKSLASFDMAKLSDISWNMFILSDAMLYIGKALAVFGQLSLGQTIVGLLGFAASMQIVIKTIKELDEVGNIFGIAASLIVLGVALTVIATAMKIFGSMSLLAIVGSLVMLAGTFALIAISARLLNGAAKYILRLAKAIVVLGIGVLSIGAGMFLLATSLVTIAAAGGAALVALIGVVKGIIGLLPFLGEKFVEMLQVMLVKLTEIMPEIGEFIKELIHMLLDVLANAVVDIVEVVLQVIEGVLEGLNKHGAQICTYILNFIFQLIDTLSRESAKIVDKLFNLLMDLIDGLGKAFNKNTDRLKQVLGDFIVNIFMGAMDLVFGGLGDLLFGNTEKAIINYVDLISEKHKELIQKAKDENDAYQELNKTREEAVKNVETEYQYVKDLKDEYNNLVDANTGLIKDGYEKRAETILTTLANATGIELEQIKSLIDENGKLSGSFDEVIRKMETQAIIQANQGAYEEAIKKRKEAYDSYVELGNEYNEAQNSYNKWITDNESRRLQIEAIENDMVRKMAMDVYNAEKMQAAAAVGSLRNAYETAEATYVGYQQIVANHQELMYEAQNGTAESIEKAADRVQYSLISAEQGTDKTLKKQVDTIKKRRDEAVKAYEAGWGNITQSEIDKWNEILGIAENELKEYEKTHEKGAKAAYSNMYDETVTGGEKVTEATKENVDAVSEELDVLPEISLATGNETVDSLVGALANGEDDIMGATSGLGDAALDGLSDLPTDMYNLGVNSGKGLTAGIKSQSGFTAEEAIIVANRYAKMYGKVMDQHSPSRRMFKMGQNTVQGLIDGLQSLREKLGFVSENTAEESFNAMADAMAGISDILTEDVDYEPTIRPVLDLGNVTAGVNAMDNLLSSDKTIQLSGTANFESTKAWSRSNQNGINVNNESVVDAIGELRTDVEALNTNMSKLQVVMDTGALVGEITVPMDKSLGRQVMYGRRGI